MEELEIILSIRDQDIQVYYKKYAVWEEAQTIMILHGWRGSSDSWLKVWELLQSEGYNVIVPDIPCASTNTVCQTEYTLEAYACLIEEFYAKLELDEVYVWWHSNWGAISILLENRKNINIKKLILNNSAWIRHDAKRSFKRKILWGLTEVVKKMLGNADLHSLPGIKALRKLFYKCIGWQDYLEAEKNEFLHKTYLNMIQTDLQQEIQKIASETLLIRGEKDIYTPVQDAHTMSEMIKNNKKIVLEGETHWIHIKSPDRLVQAFLSNI